jgi:anti-sigma factor RsiW
VKRFTCEELVELITAYLDDALDQQGREGFEAHVTCCVDCGQHVDEFRYTIRRLGELPPERKLSDGVRDRLMSAFKQHHRS